MEAAELAEPHERPRTGQQDGLPRGDVDRAVVVAKVGHQPIHRPQLRSARGLPVGAAEQGVVDRAPAPQCVEVVVELLGWRVPFARGLVPDHGLADQVQAEWITRDPRALDPPLRVLSDHLERQSRARAEDQERLLVRGIGVAQGQQLVELR